MKVVGEDKWTFPGRVFREGPTSEKIEKMVPYLLAKEGTQRDQEPFTEDSHKRCTLTRNVRTGPLSTRVKD